MSGFQTFRRREEGSTCISTDMFDTLKLYKVFHFERKLFNDIEASLNLGSRRCCVAVQCHQFFL